MDFNDLNFKFQEIADPKSLNFLDKIGQALVKIYGNMPKTVILPKIFNVQGKVEVSRPITISNLNELEKYFKSLETRLTIFAQAASTAQPPKIEFPKFDFPKQTATAVDVTPITGAIKELQDALSSTPKDNTDTALLRSIKESIESLASRPVMTPTPVTNVSINPLQGLVKTTSTTVGQTLTSLPGYGQLFNRRSLQIYNNSANTIYYGGSDVTVSNGIPVTAGSFSNVIDAGYNMIVYGIGSQGGNNVRVIEVATVAIGGVAIQE